MCLDVYGFFAYVYTLYIYRRLPLGGYDNSMFHMECTVINVPNFMNAYELEM